MSGLEIRMPFTPVQFFQVFERYNAAVFPAQIVLILAALAAVMLAAASAAAAAAGRARATASGGIVSGLLAFFWLWAGVVYHLIFFTEINPAAYLFGALFVTQGVLFFREGVIKKRLTFAFELNLYGLLGAVFILYALVIYPALGFALGHVFPASPTFGVPCPTTIFTFGLLLWANKKIARHLLIIPVFWAFFGISAALSFGVKEDVGLLIAGTIGAAFIIRRDLTPKKEVLL